MRADEIHPGLFLRGQINEEWSKARVFDELNSLGVAHVVALNHRGVWQMRGSGAYGYGFSFLEYEEHPISDGKTVDRDDVEQLAERITQWIIDDEPVLVMCNAGRNRTGLVAALVVRQLRNMTGTEALEFIREARPTAVDNSAFEAYLRSLGRP